MNESALVRIFEAPALKAPAIRHAFFTRKGGVSTGIYAGLNVGFGSDDSHEHVVENRSRAMAALDLPANALRTLYQIHSANVVTLGAAAPSSDVVLKKCATAPAISLFMKSVTSQPAGRAACIPFHPAST